MTKDTHTDNEELRRELNDIERNIYERGYQDGQSKSPFTPINNHQIDAIVQLFAPTKSSGELEEILMPLKLYASSTLEAIDPDKCVAEVEQAILAWHTTQTTKLQAEARLDELEKLESQRETVEYTSELFGTKEEKYEVSISIIWNRIAELRRELEREHKIGEDGEQ